MKLGQSFRYYYKNCSPSTASTMNHLNIRKVKQVTHVMLIFMHVIWFYTLLLATMLEKESIKTWIQQLTTWILILNSLFYVTLIYCYYSKNPASSLKNEFTKEALSKFYTMLYTLNVSLTYYFWLTIYPEVDKPVKERIFYIYTYPALSVLMNIIVQEEHLKQLHFSDLGDSVLFLSSYVVTSSLMHLATHGSHDTANHTNTVWIDSVSLRPKFFDFVLLMVLGYLQINIILKIISRFNISRPTAETTQNPTIEV